MADDLKMMVKIEAQIAKFQQDMDKAIRTQRRAADRMERQARQNADKIGRAYENVGPRIGRAFSAMPGMLRLGGGLLAGGIVGQSVRQYTRLADEATRMQNALRVAGLEGAELSRVYEQLFASAQRNSAPIGSLVDLYSKLALTQNELGVSSDELIQFTDGIAVALKVAGTDATVASGSLLQLSQALGGGVVRAEEFNSILEGTPTIAQAVARGLKEAGGSIAELRKLVVNGEVSSKAFFRAFEVGSGELQRQAATSRTTVGQAMTRIGNSLVTLIGDFDKTTGASAGLADAIGATADAMDGFDIGGIIQKLQDLGEAFRENESAVHAWVSALANAEAFKDLNDAIGITEGGQIINPDVREAEKKIDRLEGEVQTLQDRIATSTEMGFDTSEAMARLGEVRAELAAVRAEAANLPRYVAGLRPDGTVIHNMSDTGTRIDSYSPPPVPAGAVEPVSTGDYPTDDDDDDDSGTSTRRSGSRRSSRPDEFAREIEQVRERTQALQMETAQIVLAATAEGDLGEALDFARTKAELLHAAQQAGKQITPALEAEVDALAQSYVTAGMEAEEAAEKMNRIQEQSDRGKTALADMFGSIIDGSMSAKDAVANLLAEIAKTQFLNAVMGMIPGSWTSGLGGLLTPTYAEGGYTGPGGKYQPAGIVHAGEFVMSQEAVRKIGVGNLERLHRVAQTGYADGGLVGATGKVEKAISGQHRAATTMQSVTLSPSITVNASGGTPEQNQDLAQQVSRETENAMRGLIRDELVNQMRPGNMLGRGR